MRSLLALLFAASLVATERPAVDHATYTAALKDFRKGTTRSIDTLKKEHSEAAIQLAAIDDVRERLVDEPTSPLVSEVAALLAKTDSLTAELLLSALAEAKASSATAQVAELAANPQSPLRIPAALALAEIGGAKAVPILAALAKDETLADNIQEALMKVAGPGVTDAFNAGIADAKVDIAMRNALIKAAVARNLRAVAGTLCLTIKEEPMRLECQKALLKLAQKTDLPALRDAERSVTSEATKGALGRLIKKLEAVK
ncbi:MAG: HEAT repeat domain-containing protein [Verrucomicrobia bacterium]|jgi:HEAT repeat protein|nr:HEAT repeat domain-containing protein [Verrucomicrobiota bacterium]NBS05070.1 HEAT repeat domain-containing protein [Verrucomicrobiota bacterium]NBY35976.1 HEAT repeat domain-containing protein [Verrucomicrobiota bacterium]